MKRLYLDGAIRRAEVVHHWHHDLRLCQESKCDAHVLLVLQKEVKKSQSEAGNNVVVAADKKRQPFEELHEQQMMMVHVEKELRRVGEEWLRESDGVSTCRVKRTTHHN